MEFSNFNYDKLQLFSWFTGSKFTIHGEFMGGTFRISGQNIKRPEKQRSLELLNHESGPRNRRTMTI